MRWVPSHVSLLSLHANLYLTYFSQTNDPSRTLWSSGLYRVRGTTVEAIVGGIFHQFVSMSMSVNRLMLTHQKGGLAAHRLFHTRLLPHLSAASALPISDSLRQAVADAATAYGGANAPLIRSPEKEGRITVDRPIRKPAGEALRMPVGEFGFTGAKKPFPSGPPRLPPPENSVERTKLLPRRKPAGSAGLMGRRRR